MTQPIPLERPEFEQVFNSKHLWALDKNELKIDNQMKRIVMLNFFLVRFIRLVKKHSLRLNKKFI
jgi:hypothetical protein